MKALEVSAKSFEVLAMERLQACGSPISVKTPFAAVPIAAKRPIVEKSMLAPEQPKLFGEEIEQSELFG